MDDIIDEKKMGKEKAKSLSVAEQARETEWTLPSFVQQLFNGNVHWEHLLPFAQQDEADKKIGDEFLLRLEPFLKENLDPDLIDQTGDITEEQLKGLADLGLFGIKIPKKYGGLGMSKFNYNRIVGMVASHCASTAVYLSAHQSIGVPQPLLLFGTEEQKQKYLPRFAKGEISAFALTEPNVGSDPAQMSTIATPIDGGESYLINGEKLWCTNGTRADVLIVMAQTPPKVVNGKERKQITAFIVEKTMPGFEILHRCSFMGLHGIQNGLLKFTDVKVPKENIIWGLGKGLKLALTTLNTGRLTIPAAATAVGRVCLKVSKDWSNERCQWGSKIGEHEAVASKLSFMASNLFTMDSVNQFTSIAADKGNMDIRLEAAIAKLYCTEASWTIADETVQIRGGRGYESSPSLKARGELGIPAERILRDARINTIIEGTSEIMRLFISREAMDDHVRRITMILSPKRSLVQRFISVIKSTFHYALWYPKQWIYITRLGHSSLDPTLKKHLKYVDKTSHKLARNLFHVMAIYQQGLEKKQQVLFRLVDIGMYLFTMATTCANAQRLMEEDPEGEGLKAKNLADLYCREAKKKIKARFTYLFDKDDKFSYKIAQEVLDGNYDWMENDIILPY